MPGETEGAGPEAPTITVWSPGGADLPVRHYLRVPPVPRVRLEPRRHLCLCNLEGGEVILVLYVDDILIFWDRDERASIA